MSTKDLEGQWVHLAMTAERKELWNRCVTGIIELCQKSGLTPIETHAVLTICRDSIGEIYKIRESRLLSNTTEVQQ